MAEHFHALRVKDVVAETADANSIRFEIPPELRDRFVFKAGQHLTLRATIHGGLAILDRIDAASGDVFRHRPVLKKLDWIAILARAL